MVTKMAVERHSLGLFATSPITVLLNASKAASVEYPGWPSNVPSGLTIDTAGSVPARAWLSKAPRPCRWAARWAGLVMIEVAYWNGLQMLQYWLRLGLPLFQSWPKYPQLMPWEFSSSPMVGKVDSLCGGTAKGPGSGVPSAR